MWSPTHVQVTVQRARGLIAKGKSGTNDAFVTIALGKEKFQTSIKEKASETLEWHEKCELQIPKQGNKAELILTVLHHNFIGVDEFLGCIYIPLSDLDAYERPKNKWIKLRDKPGKDKNKDRGELEVKISFIVKSGSLLDLSKKEKHKSSLGQLPQTFGGSLISISSLDKRKGLKKLANKIGHKIGKVSKKPEEPQKSLGEEVPGQKGKDADPGVDSDEDDFMLDELSQKGSGSSLNWPTTPARSEETIPQSSPRLSKPPRVTPETAPPSQNAPSENLPPLSVNKKEPKSKMSPMKQLFGSKSSLGSSMERIIIGKEVTRNPSPDTVSSEVVKQYNNKTREDLIKLVSELKLQLEDHKKQKRDLEEYIDNLLLRVMETSPRILQNPYVNCKTQYV